MNQTSDQHTTGTGHITAERERRLDNLLLAADPGWQGARCAPTGSARSDGGLYGAPTCGTATHGALTDPALNGHVLDDKAYDGGALDDGALDERALDDRAWQDLSRVLCQPPGGFRRARLAGTAGERRWLVALVTTAAVGLVIGGSTAVVASRSLSDPRPVAPAAPEVPADSSGSNEPGESTEAFVGIESLPAGENLYQRVSYSYGGADPADGNSYESWTTADGSTFLLGLSRPDGTGAQGTSHIFTAASPSDDVAASLLEELAELDSGDLPVDYKLLVDEVTVRADREEWRQDLLAQGIDPEDILVEELEQPFGGAVDATREELVAYLAGEGPQPPEEAVSFYLGDVGDGVVGLDEALLLAASPDAIDDHLALARSTEEAFGTTVDGMVVADPQDTMPGVVAAVLSDPAAPVELRRALLDGLLRLTDSEVADRVDPLGRQATLITVPVADGDGRVELYVSPGTATLFSAFTATADGTGVNAVVVEGQAVVEQIGDRPVS